MYTYAELDDALTGRAVIGRKVANNTHAVRNSDSIGIVLHSTEVVTLYPDGWVRLNSGGWMTSTTRERMNRYLGARWYVCQRKGVWYVGDRDHGHALIPYTDGMMILA